MKHVLGFSSCLRNVSRHDEFPDPKTSKFISLRNTEVSIIEWDSLENVTYVNSDHYSLVYKAMYEERDVTVKVLKNLNPTLNQPNPTLPFEAQILSSIHHQNVATLIGVGQCKTPSICDFIVLEYLEQGTLSDFLEDCSQKMQRVSLWDGLNFGFKLANVMGYLHYKADRSKRLVHCNLSPDNIGFSSNELKLLDFECAKYVPRSIIHRKKLCKIEDNIRNRRYQAPEVVLEGAFSEKSDVYSFSLILWQVLVLAVPYREMDSHQHLEKVVNQDFRPSIPEEWPSELKTLLSQCWHKLPRKRPTFPVLLRKIDAIISAMEESSHVGPTF
mmetsp:Transcript_12196/g.15809  ORF Transcript_12196/g.15809 Transcript_12196/m.15809 type:complete len:329 (-) Transcript_12196:59-1045(-)